MTAITSFVIVHAMQQEADLPLSLLATCSIDATRY